MSFVDMVYLCKKDLTYGFIRYTRKNRTAVDHRISG